MFILLILVPQEYIIQITKVGKSLFIVLKIGSPTLRNSSSVTKSKFLSSMFYHFYAFLLQVIYFF